MQKWGFSAIFLRLVYQIDLILHTMEELSSPYNLTVVLLTLVLNPFDYLTTSKYIVDSYLLQGPT